MILSRRPIEPLLALVGCCLVLMGCSSAADYSDLMSSFSGATDKAKSAIETYDKTAAARMTDIVRTEAIKDHMAIVRVGNDCNRASTRCRFVAHASSTDSNPKQLTIASLASEHLAAMQQIALYAKALKDITAADATAQVKAAVDKAAGATTALAALAGPTAPAITAFVAPAGQLVVWAFGKYQENLKLSALRHATKDMRSTMKEATAKFGEIANLMLRPERGRLADDVLEKEKKFEANPSRATLDALLTAAEKLDEMLSLSPEKVFKDLGAAHEALATSLDSDQPMALSQAFVLVNRLAADAEALYGVAEALRKAAEAKRK